VNEREQKKPLPQKKRVVAPKKIPSLLSLNTYGDDGRWKRKHIKCLRDYETSK
jgi:hypothetical protein